MLRAQPPTRVVCKSRPSISVTRASRVTRADINASTRVNCKITFWHRIFSSQHYSATGKHELYIVWTRTFVSHRRAQLDYQVESTSENFSTHDRPTFIRDPAVFRIERAVFGVADSDGLRGRRDVELAPDLRLTHCTGCV